jgi:hypothetical protein
MSLRQSLKEWGLKPSTFAGFGCCRAQVIVNMHTSSKQAQLA